LARGGMTRFTTRFLASRRSAIRRARLFTVSFSAGEILSKRTSFCMALNSVKISLYIYFIGMTPRLVQQAQAIFLSKIRKNLIRHFPYGIRDLATISGLLQRRARRG